MRDNGNEDRRFRCLAVLVDSLIDASVGDVFVGESGGKSAGENFDTGDNEGLLGLTVDEGSTIVLAVIVIFLVVAIVETGFGLLLLLLLFDIFEVFSGITISSNILPLK